MTSATPSKPKVHVIDDDDAVRDSLAFLLRSADIDVATHESAAAFLRGGVPSGFASVEDILQTFFGGGGFGFGAGGDLGVPVGGSLERPDRSHRHGAVGVTAVVVEYPRHKPSPAVG